MSSPLQVNGGLQYTGNAIGTSASLNFNKTSASIIVDTVYGQDINLVFGGHNLAFTNNIVVVSYDATRMFLIF